MPCLQRWEVARSNAAYVAKRAKEEAEAKKAQKKIDKAAQAVATVVKASSFGPVAVGEVRPIVHKPTFIDIFAFCRKPTIAGFLTPSP